jgi:antitoxin component YwqK of YwqJK toxin-antitoxin module
VVSANPNKENAMYYIKNGTILLLACLVFVPSIICAEVETEYWPNGNLRWERTYTDGKLDGVCKEYDENGTLREEIPFKNGKKDGIYRSYYSDGKLRNEASYKNGLKDGEETTHLRWENKKTVSTYQNGKAINTKRYDEKGRLRDELLFEYGEEGSWRIRQKLYDQKGKLILDQTL